MTVQYAQIQGLGDKQRTIPRSIPPVVVPAPNTWTRPSDWAALPSISPTDQKFAGIYAVWDNDTGYVALRATTSTGDYQVDWGDGSSPTTHSSNSVAQYKFDYSTISSSPTTFGYKTVCITVTAVSGNLTGIDIDEKYVNTPVLPTTTTQWLDIYLGSPNFTTVNITNTNSPQVYHYYLQRCRIVSFNITSTSYMFYFCRKLQVVELPSMSSITTTDNMFNQCTSLQEVPSMTLTSCTNATNMFNACYSLVKVPELNFHPSSNVDLTSTFIDCRSLELAPKITGKIVNMSNTFTRCQSLRSIDGIDTSNVSNMRSTFETCSSLQTIPILNTINVIDFSGTFAGSGLTYFPNLNLSNATNLGAAFRLCESLVTVANLNLPKVTSTERMFDGCSSVNYVNVATTGNLTTANSMFNNCFNLTTFANFDTSNVSNGSGMFSSCISLNEVPNINTSNMSNARSMFFSCGSLLSVPTFDFGNVTNCEAMFSNCTSLLSVGNINTVKATNMINMFGNCFSLKEGPNIPTSNVTSFAAMFNVCSTMVSVPTYDTANATGFNVMFNECQALESVGNLDTSKGTNVTNMFLFCRSLNSIPALNLTNVTSATSFAASCISLGSVTSSNINANITFTTCLLDKTNIENIFSNLKSGSNTARSIAVTTNPGNDTVVTKSSNTTSASNVVVIANTVGLSTGMLVTGNNISNGRAVTFQDTGDTVTLNNHGINNNTIVSFSTITTTTGISIYTPYYVVNTQTNTFQVASSEGGAALPLTTNGNGTLLYGTFIDTINANANIIISTPASGTATGQTLTFSVLNTSIATLKNWSVTR